MPSEATTLTIRWSEEIIQSSWSIDYNGFSGSPYLYSKAYYEGIFEAEIPLMLNSLINEGTELCLYVESLEITQISINGGEAINPVAADGWGNYFNITMPGEDMVIKYNPSVSSAYTLTYEPGESGLDATFHIMDDYGGFGEAVTEADAGDQAVRDLQHLSQTLQRDAEDLVLLSVHKRSQAQARRRTPEHFLL